QEFVMWYLKSAFDTYEKVQSAMSNRLSEVESAILSPVETMKRFLGAPPASSGADAGTELDSLRKRIAELEDRLKQSTPKKRARRKRR
ncbi:MAG TPA: pesticin, partial [Terriglobales bacterium]|nr:pesticin [Terriglobales bacterium]